tara:strand:- start:3799 stop:5412 length:1614 start_codon:yes stop_codon:yes gene_type:complete
MTTNKTNFTWKSLNTRLKKDIQKFSKLTSFSIINMPHLPTTGSTNVCKKIFSEMTEMTHSKTSNKNFDYHHIIGLNDISQKDKYTLWIKRTILFYNILLCVGDMMENLKDNNLKRENYDIGIFGSMKPTSDIDVGISLYTKDRHSFNKSNLIVKMFEDFILTQLGINSLQLDIEMYVDVLVINCNNIDVYSADMSKLNNDFKHTTNKNIRILLLASMFRSYAIGLKEKNKSKNEIIQLIKKLNNNTIKQLFKLVSSKNILNNEKIDFKEIDLNKDGILDREEIVTAAQSYNMTPAQASQLFDKLDVDGDGVLTEKEYKKAIKLTERFSLSQITDTISNNSMRQTKNNIIKKMSSMFKLNEIDEAKTKVVEYVELLFDNSGDYTNYNSFRELYYEYATLACKSIDNIQSKCNDPPVQKDIMDLIYSIGWANFYRAESYLIPPTIIHVVRILQQNENTDKCKYDAAFPTCAINSMTEFSYKCSAFEQLGYMIRFIENKAKFEKYKVRFNDAVIQINRFPKRQKTKKNNKKNKTRSKKKI